MNRSESKYFATAEKMDKAFLKLLEKKDFAYITVKEICEKAGVNRSTFYLHYETLADLLEECAKYITKDFLNFMPQETIPFFEKMQNCSLEELYLITPEYLMPYLEYIKANRRIFRTTIEQASTLKMDEAYETMNRYIFFPILERFQVPSADREYMMSYYINGLVAIINDWLMGDCKNPIEQIIRVMQSCTMRPLKDLKETK